eukprot:TRINITY_DN23140_c0_g1_i1.p1 TRINITY_DN23140_c0_g1~~TRINITY_DN23140_c0_g1_i1.p1  ORF type:complete len:288 (+),score=6.63 TRINITY_DN23140_c0_g1_i1:305-1168(+)
MISMVPWRRRLACLPRAMLTANSKDTFRSTTLSTSTSRSSVVLTADSERDFTYKHATIVRKKVKDNVERYKPGASDDLGIDVPSGDENHLLATQPSRAEDDPLLFTPAPAFGRWRFYGMLDFFRRIFFPRPDFPFARAPERLVSRVFRSDSPFHFEKVDISAISCSALLVLFGYVQFLVCCSLPARPRQTLAFAFRAAFAVRAAVFFRWRHGPQAEQQLSRRHREIAFSVLHLVSATTQSWFLVIPRGRSVRTTERLCGIARNHDCVVVLSHCSRQCNWLRRLDSCP